MREWQRDTWPGQDLTSSASTNPRPLPRQPECPDHRWLALAVSMTVEPPTMAEWRPNRWARSSWPFVRLVSGFARGPSSPTGGVDVAWANRPMPGGGCLCAGRWLVASLGLPPTARPSACRPARRFVPSAASRDAPRAGRLAQHPSTPPPSPFFDAGMPSVPGAVCGWQPRASRQNDGPAAAVQLLTTPQQCPRPILRAALFGGACSTHRWHRWHSGGYPHSAPSSM